MLTTFGEKTGEKLASEMLIQLLTPVGIFWIGGLAAWAWQAAHQRSGGLTEVGKRMAGLPTVVQVMLVVVAVVVIVISAVVSARLTLPMLRILEGYWPAGLGAWAAGQVHKRRERIQRKAGLLERARRENGLSARQANQFAALQAHLRNTPGLLEQTMPTKFGNRLRASELRPLAKHGLDVTACWPHLWLVLDQEPKAELARARSELDAAAQAFWWSLALVAWTPLTLWMLPLGPVVAAAIYYTWLLSAAQNHGDLLEAVFDLFSPRLYQAVRWPLPESTDTERDRGTELTRYLWQGLAPQGRVFEDPPVSKEQADAE
jgi:hypothetical protein